MDAQGHAEPDWALLAAKKPWKVRRVREAWERRKAEKRFETRRSPSTDADGPAEDRLPRHSVVGCRVDAADLSIIDMMVEAGVRTTRSEAAAWFIHEGITAQHALVEEIRGTVAEIRRLRERVQARARERSGQA